jgi:hypothetical protein
MNNQRMLLRLGAFCSRRQRLRREGSSVSSLRVSKGFFRNEPSLTFGLLTPALFAFVANSF